MNHWKTRGSRLLGAGLALALVASGCGEKRERGEQPDTEDVDFQEDDSLEAVSGGSVRYGLGAETDGWNPLINRWAGSGQQVAFAIYDHLAELDENGDPLPYLAESIEPSDDNKTWTITLRDGVTFHNGDALTADAVRQNIEAHQLSPLTGKAIAPIQTITVVDDLTLELQMDISWVAFPVFLTSQVGVVAAPESLGYDAGDPEQTAEERTGEITANNKPVGTGPFVFDTWEIDRQLVVTKYDGYWREGLPHLNEIVFQPVIDPGNRITSLSAGDLDVIQMSVSAGGINDLRDIACTEDPCDDGTVKIYDNKESAEGEEGMMMVNTLRPPFDEPLARRAVAHAINRDDLLNTVFQGVFDQANGPYAPGSEWYTDLTEFIPEFNPDTARELAAEYQAKTGEPITFEFSIPIGLAEVEETAKVVTEQLNAVGIEADVKQYEMTKYIEKLISGDYQGIAFQWFGNADPDAEYVWWHSSSIPTDESGELLPTGGISLNFARLSDPEVDAALDAARSMEDPAERKAQYDIVQERFAEDLAFMWLFHGYSMVAWRPRVRDVVSWTFPDGAKGQPLNGTGAHPVAEMWVEQD